MVEGLVGMQGCGLQDEGSKSLASYSLRALKLTLNPKPVGFRVWV